MRQAVQLAFPDESDRQQLLRMELDAESMAGVGLRMLEAGASAHPYGARNSAGYWRWDSGLAALGDAYVPRNWKRTLRDGVEMLINSSETMGISVNSISDGIGNEDDTLVARYPRGSSVVRRVYSNAVQLGLFPDMESVGHSETFKLWMLVHKYENFQLAVELVLPNWVESDRRTISVERRIRIGVFGFEDGSDGGGHIPPSFLPPGPTITIEPR